MQTKLRESVAELRGSLSSALLSQLQSQQDDHIEKIQDGIRSVLSLVLSVMFLLVV